jgi:hypothetical protein
MKMWGKESRIECQESRGFGTRKVGKMCRCADVQITNVRMLLVQSQEVGGRAGNQEPRRKLYRKDKSL